MTPGQPALAAMLGIDAVLAAFRVHLRVAAITPLAMVFALLTPLVYGIIVASGSGRPGIAVIVGTGLAGMIGTIIPQSVITILQERTWLTLEQVALSQVGTATILVGRLLAMTAHALAGLPVAWLVIVLLFGPVHVPSPGQVLASIAVSAGGFLAVSLLIVGLLARRRYYAGMPNGLLPLLLLLSGVFVPASALPWWLALPSRLLAPTWAMEGLRRLEAGRQAWPDIGIGAAVSVVTIALGVLYLRRLDHHMRTSPEAYLR